jgi:DNA-binding transcriptional LysR family regulator
MNIRLLETFVWLTRLKNFGKTAEKLNTTQPAISSRMSKLEETLGAELYQRQSREFDLTTSGRQALVYAERILDLWHELVLSIDKAPNLLKELKVGIIEIGTLSWLSLFIEHFRSQFTDVTLNLTTGTTSTLLEELREGRLDMAFVVGPVNEPNVLSEQICSCAIEWFANPIFFPFDHEIDVVELSRLPIIMYAKHSSAYNTIRQYFETYGVVDLPMRHRRIVMDFVYSAWSGAHAVREGLGVMALPSFLFEKEISEGTLLPIPVRQKIPAINMTACYAQAARTPFLVEIAQLARTSAATFAQSQKDDYFWI